MNNEDFIGWCKAMTDLGMPVKIIRELATTGKAEWTSPSENGGVATTTYEVMDDGH